MRIHKFIKAVATVIIILCSTFSTFAQFQDDEIVTDTIPCLIIALDDNSFLEFEISDKLRLINRDGMLQIGLYEKIEDDTDDKDDPYQEDPEDPDNPGEGDEEETENPADMSIRRISSEGDYGLLKNVTVIDPRQIISAGIAYKVIMPTAREELKIEYPDTKGWTIHTINGYLVASGKHGRPDLRNLKPGEIYIINTGRKSFKYMPLQ